MRRKPITGILILLTAILICSFTTAMADEEENVWNGYDLQVLNTYDIQLVGQNSIIEVNEDKLVYNGEYVIKNMTQNTLEAILGLPSNNLENIQITEKGSSVKHYNRSKSYIEDKYPSDALPNVARWYTASLWFKAGESKVINIKYETKLINDYKSMFSIRYYKNKQLINSEASKIILSMHNFYPYDVLDTIGVSAEKTVLAGNERFTMEMNRESEMLGIDYELVDKLAVDRFDFSSDKKLKNIAASFKKKDYNSVLILCDEYMSNPTDSTFNLAQVKYIKAEAYRKQVDFSKYIEYIKELNFDMLYPSRLRYKILYDLDQMLGESVQDAKLLDIMKTLHTKAIEDNEYIGIWLESMGKNYLETAEAMEPELPAKDIEEDDIFSKTIAFLKLDALIERIKGFKYLPVIGVAISFVAGYILGRRKRKKKNIISYYKF